MHAQGDKLVPGKSHYEPRYVRGGRLFSYAHQTSAVLEFEPTSVLEIGPGPGMVTAALRALNIDVTTVDVQPELEPDIIASVTKLPADSNSVDVSMCCQVLEHLPLDQFVPALRELSRVSCKAVVVSLPDCSVGYRIYLNLPTIRDVEWRWSRLRRPTENDRKTKLERDGHYWEIGYPDVTTKFVRARFGEAGLKVERCWRVPEMPYHRFFVSTPIRVAS